MVIRNYDDEDFPQVEELLKKSGIYWPAYDRREILKKKIDNDPESIIVAEENGKVVGTIFFVYDPWSSYILHLAVDAEHRNKGIGTRLFQTAEQRLKARGKKIVAGFIKEENESVLDYCKKRGYYVSGKVFFMNKIIIS